MLYRLCMLLEGVTFSRFRLNVEPKTRLCTRRAIAAKRKDENALRILNEHVDGHATSGMWYVASFAASVPWSRQRKDDLQSP